MIRKLHIKHVFTNSISITRRRFMHSVVIACIAVLVSHACYAVTNVDNLLSKFDLVPTLSTRNMLDNKSFSFIKHANIPKNQTCIDTRYEGDVSTEIADLMKGLKRAIKAEYLPTEDDLAQIVPCVNLWEDGTDYLVLSYKTKSGMIIYVEDGFNINIKITTGLSCKLDDVKQYVVDLATEVLDVSSADEQMRVNPRIGMIATDIGDSRAGQLDFGRSPVTGAVEWYSIPGWWSDGHSVLFSLSKIDFEKRMRTAKVSTSKPRTFKSRMILSTKP